MSTTDEQNNESNETSASTASNASNDTSAASAAPKADEKPDPYAALRGKELSAADAEALIEKLAAANGEAASYRHKVRELEQASEGEIEKKVRESKETGAAEAATKYEPIIIRLSAAQALTEAGATKGHDSLIRLFDPAKIKVAEDGTVTGLDKEIARVKGEFPALFEAAPETSTRRTAPGSRLDGGKKTEGAEKKTAAQIHAERALGRN